MVLPQVASSSFPPGLSKLPSGKLVSTDLVFKELFDATVSTPLMGSLAGQGASKEIAAKTARKNGNGNGNDGQDRGNALTADIIPISPHQGAQLKLLSFLPFTAPVNHSSAQTADIQKEAFSSAPLDKADAILQLIASQLLKATLPPRFLRRSNGAAINC